MSVSLAFVRELAADRDRLLAVNAKLLDALKYYRDEWEPWQETESADGGTGIAPTPNLCDDKGSIANAAIKSAEASHG